MKEWVIMKMVKKYIWARIDQDFANTLKIIYPFRKSIYDATRELNDKLMPFINKNEKKKIF